MNWEIQLLRPVHTRRSFLPATIRTLGEAVDMIDEMLPESLRFRAEWQAAKDMLVYGGRDQNRVRRRKRDLSVGSRSQQRGLAVNRSELILRTPFSAIRDGPYMTVSFIGREFLPTLSMPPSNEQDYLTIQG